MLVCGVLNCKVWGWVCVCGKIRARSRRRNKNEDGIIMAWRERHFDRMAWNKACVVDYCMLVGRIRRTLLLGGSQIEREGGRERQYALTASKQASTKKQVMS